MSWIWYQMTETELSSEPAQITYEGNDVVGMGDKYGDWICVLNYEHYGGTNPTVSPDSTFPQLPNGLSDVSFLQNNGGNGELRHVDNISQYGITNVDVVKLEGYTSNHSRKLHYFTQDQTVIDSIVDNSTNAGHNDLQNNITKYSDHTTDLPDNTGDTNQTDQGSNHIFGYGFPMYGTSTYVDNNSHWAIAGNGDRW